MASNINYVPQSGTITILQAPRNEGDVDNPITMLLYWNSSYKLSINIIASIKTFSRPIFS